MTVNTLSSIAEFETNGVTTNFPFYFKFLSNDDLVVTYVSPAGVSTTLTLGTHYTVNGAGNESGGSVVTTSALAGPGQLVVSREMEAFQQTALRNQGKFLAETHEDVFDKLTMLIQQGFSIFKRALTRPFGRDYFFAEDRRIASVADPVEDQDAVTKLYNEQYIAQLLSTYGGPINSAANVLFVAPDGISYPIQGLAASNDVKKGDAFVAVRKAAAGLTAINRTQHSVNEETVTLNDFNDIPDAIAWSMSSTGRRCIILPGGELDMTGKKFLLPATPVEPTSPLYFRSAGGTKIIKNDGGYLFDVNGAFFYDLITEGLQFEGVQNAGCILFNTDKIIRLTVERCHSKYIDHYMKGTSYCQTVRMVNNTQRYGQSFCSHLYGYDVWFAGNIIEHGLDGIKFTRSSGDYALLNSVIQSNVIEGMTGVGIQLGACAAVQVIGNYQELNGTYSDFNASIVPHAGLQHRGNWYFMTAPQIAASKFPVVTGNHGKSFVSGGNFSNGNMYDNTACTSTMLNLEGGDYFLGQLYKGHTALNDPARNPVNGAHFFEGHKEVWAFNKQTTFIDAVTGSRGFGSATTSVTIGSQLVHPEELWGSANPQTSPGVYGNRAWARGSRVYNNAPVMSGTVPNRVYVGGWTCLQSSANTSGDPGVWIEWIENSYS